MKLTNRRKQFLEKIVQMHSSSDQPVHYSDIAESIGVSKWTAYDVLKELEKHGFLQRTYTINPNETGRSLVVYVPTEKSQNLFEQNNAHLTDQQEWAQIKREVLHFINNHSEDSDTGIEQLLEKFSTGQSKVELCASFIGVLLVHLNSQGRTVKNLTVNLVNVSAAPSIQIATFTGAVIGMMIDSASDGMSTDMLAIVNHFTSALEDLNEQERQYLVEFIREA
ncbi:hypothetical protein [Salipaludibacillus aurantiacus]|uniref:Iron dependent repressor, N-terminal DNA binding domain n=1 Tax=Salipaludibacillus aurantiacus TaxID=1601833 RepID=A0A1H9Q2S7_9BACI|nr:hypothetical protein [Salipaludibacillus aurantiacus]SER54730.1 Iron dependent repressor, N-terminal DNA binding domain [Salipaludibacillus aurantiacus]